MRVAFWAAAAVLILAGASLTTAGRGDSGAVVAVIVGLLAVAAGVAYAEWTIAAPIAGAALVVALFSDQFQSGKLTDEEFAQMKAHTTIGFDILSGLKMLTDQLVIVRSHHER